MTQFYIGYIIMFIGMIGWGVFTFLFWKARIDGKFPTSEYIMYSILFILIEIAGRYITQISR